MNCGTLTNPANGRVSHTAGTTFGRTATYSCNTGYSLVGDSTRMCQTTGVWSRSAPTCQGMLLSYVCMCRARARLRFSQAVCVTWKWSSLTAYMSTNFHYTGMLEVSSTLLIKDIFSIVKSWGGLTGSSGTRRYWFEFYTTTTLLVTFGLYASVHDKIVGLGDTPHVFHGDGHMECCE